VDAAEHLERLARARSSGSLSRFNDRHEAGKLLAQHLLEYTNDPSAIVLALPRGGVPVAFEIAQALHLPLDILVVKKITVPGYDELALGAAASDRICYIDESLTTHFGLSREEIATLARLAYEEVERREAAYRNHRPVPQLEGKTIILVDDGLATGSSMQIAVAAARRKNPARVIVAVPVASKEAAMEIKEVADDVVFAAIPDPFYAVGAWYGDFSQTSDEEVRDLLEQARSQEA
jgi:putative phosphoribosyl transferase